MGPQAQYEDFELLKSAGQGSEAAFAELYRRRQGGVFRFALHMTGSEHAAEEVTQDVFLNLIRGLKKFDAGRGSVEAWLYGIARKCVLRHTAANRLAVPLESCDEPAEEPPDLGRTQAIESVRRAVLALPEPFREAVALCDLEELSYDQAAGAMGVPIGTVRSRLSRGRALLGEMLRGAALRCLV